MDRAAIGCTPDDHEVLRSEPARFRLATKFRGYCDDGAVRLELRECPRCGSTLSIGIHPGAAPRQGVRLPPLPPAPVRRIHQLVDHRLQLPDTLGGRPLRLLAWGLAAWAGVLAVAALLSLLLWMRC